MTTPSTEGGEYTEVDPPARLAFTWIWDDDPGSTRQLIEIHFEESDGATTGQVHPQRSVKRGGRALP